ncbi:MAG: SigE family RNA polymerase sigma factor [Actinomycetia bacterium]|nr:SigE family RNA polymerase sigma factor [Actinomycetes bacterium]
MTTLPTSLAARRPVTPEARTVLTADPEFTRFVLAEQHRLLRMAHLICGDPVLAEDLVQDALIKLADRWESVDHPKSFVRQVISRDAISWWRRWRREALTDSLPEPPGRSGPDHAEALALRAALAQLPARQRTAVVLRYFEDLTEAQTAEVMGVRVGTIKSLCHTAMKALRTQLTDKEQIP